MADQSKQKKMRANNIFRLGGYIPIVFTVFFFDAPLVIRLFFAAYVLFLFAWALIIELNLNVIYIESLRYLRLTMDLFAYTVILYMFGTINFALIVFAMLVGVASLYETRRYALYALVLTFILINSMIGLVATGILPQINILAGTASQPMALSIPLFLMCNLSLFISCYAVYKMTHTNYVNLTRTTLQLQQTSDDLARERTTLRDRNEIIEHDLMLARRIQENLIPAAPVRNFISAVYRPMDEVGGDFYDFITFDDSEAIGIFLSDVSGHGVPAAFITSMIKTVLLQAGERLKDPAALLLYMNEVLQCQTAGNFVTSFYALFEPRSRTLVYSNAGHPQPYLINGERVTQLQGGKNTAIAIFPNNLLVKANKTFLNYRETLDPGAKLLLFTDGLVETRPVGGLQFFEYGPMKNVFSRHANVSCTAFLNAIMTALIDFRQTDSFDDDICMICLDVS